MTTVWISICFSIAGTPASVVMFRSLYHRTLELRLKGEFRFNSGGARPTGGNPAKGSPRPGH